MKGQNLFSYGDNLHEMSNQFSGTNKKKHFKIHYENTPIQNILKISPPKTANFQIKIMIFFRFLLKT